MNRDLKLGFLDIYDVDSNIINWEVLDTFDWIQEMKTTPQDSEWHAEGNVYIHTQMVCNELINLPEFKQCSVSEKICLVMAALFHDVEKRSTTSEEVIEGVKRIISPRHAKKGEYTSRKLIYINFPKTPYIAREEVCKLVRHHELPLWAISKEDPNKEVITSSLVVSNRLLYILAKANILGRICNDKDSVLLNLELFKGLCLDNQCYESSKRFPFLRTRYMYLNEGKPIDYVPYQKTSKKFEVIMMSGIPGSGKDTYIKNNLKDYPSISLDSIRRSRNIKPTDKKGNGQVIQAAQEACKGLLRSKTSFVFNATNITSDMRSKWIKLFKDYKAYVKIVYIEVSFKDLIRQNALRKHKVPENVILKLINKLEIPHPKECDEIIKYINHEKDT